MPTETVSRTWTMASWLVAPAANEPDTVGEALLTAESVDAIALQSLRETDAERIANRLGASCARELSFSPRAGSCPAAASDSRS